MTDPKKGDLGPDDFRAWWDFSGRLGAVGELRKALGQPTFELDDKSSTA